MKKWISFIIFFLFFLNTIFSQNLKNNTSGILFHGLVMDAGTEVPLSNTQVIINRNFFSMSDNEGKFAFYVLPKDTVVFSRLGYKSTNFFVGDTLTGKEFIAGIYMQTDTLSIGEVIIVPRFSNLRSQLMSPMAPANAQSENAKFNLAVSAYQGRVNVGKTGDPATNYQVLRQKQRNYAYSKGQIPSDQIAAISPLLLIPASYLLLNGLPEKPAPLQPRLTEQEVDQIHKKYLETLRKQK